MIALFKQAQFTLYKTLNLSSFFKFIQLAVSCLLLSCGSYAAMATDDDYLKAMEAEAENIQLDSANSNKPTKPSVTVDPQEKPNKNTITFQQQKEFETALRERLPRSFKSYASLSDENKADVVHTYFNNSKNLLLAIKRLYKLHFKH